MAQPSGPLLTSLQSGEAQIEKLETSVVIFDDELAANWWNCSWGGLFFVDAPAWAVSTHSGTASVAANLSPSGALSFCTSEPFGTSLGDFGLSLWVVGNSDAADMALVFSKGAPSAADVEAMRQGSGASVAVTADALSRGTTFAKPLSDFIALSTTYWTHVLVPFEDIPQPARGFDRVSFMDTSGRSKPVFLMDDVQIVRVSGSDACFRERCSTDLLLWDIPMLHVKCLRSSALL